MKVEWNKVTWYSKMIALALFVSLPFMGFYLGTVYEKSVNPATKSLGSYSNLCKAGEVALFEGGIFSSCQKPTTNSSTATSSSSTSTIKTYKNPCANEQVALYEGGIFSACAKPSQ